MLSRLLAVIRSTVLRSLSGKAAATVAISLSSGTSPGLTTASTNLGRQHLLRLVRHTGLVDQDVALGLPHREHRPTLDDGNRDRARPVAGHGR